VAEEHEHGASGEGESGSGEMMSATSGIDASLASDTNFSGLDVGLDMGGSDELDLSDLGESADETASIRLPPSDEEELSLGEEPVSVAAPSAPKEEGLELGDFDLELGAEEKTPAAKEETMDLDLGDADAPRAQVAKSAPPASTGNEKGLDLDLSEMELGLGEVDEKMAPPKPGAGEEEEFDLSDLDLGGEEASGERSGTDALDALGSTGATPVVEDAEEPAMDFDLGIEEEPAAKAPKAGANPEPDNFSMDGLDLDLDLTDFDLSDSAEKPEGKKKETPEKKKEDDLDIDLSDLKLE
jgi:hypothetical protein